MIDSSFLASFFIFRQKVRRETERRNQSKFTFLIFLFVSVNYRSFSSCFPLAIVKKFEFVVVISNDRPLPFIFTIYHQSKQSILTLTLTLTKPTLMSDADIVICDWFSDNLHRDHW